MVEWRPFSISIRLCCTSASSETRRLFASVVTKLADSDSTLAPAIINTGMLQALLPLDMVAGMLAAFTLLPLVIAPSSCRMLLRITSRIMMRSDLGT